MPAPSGPPARRRSRALAVLVLLLVSLATSTTERASDPPPAYLPPLEPDQGPSIAGDVAFAVEAPIMLGAQATLELPYGFLLQSELGVLPAFAIDAVDGALVSSGAYDASVSNLVTGSLGDSLVFRLSGGIRPFPDAGFEMLVGYTVVALGGGVDARDAVAAAGGGALPVAIPEGEVTLHSTIHNVHMSLGWRWIIADHFLVRASVGYLQTVTSSSSVRVPSAWQSDPTVSAAVAVANPVIDTELASVYSTYVKLPVLGLSMGYRF